jgi:hypothetical protein
VLSFCGCVTSNGATGQGGAAFNPPGASKPSVPVEALYDLCWPADATAQQRVKLVTLGNGEVIFEALEGASNSTARCLREIATSYPGPRAAGEVKVTPPPKSPSGWVVLAYVQLLSAARFGPERGVLDPAPLIQACLSRGDAPRVGVRFAVTIAPELKVSLESSDGFVQPALTDSERCIEAVLGSTVWPNTRGFTLDFSSRDPSGAPGQGEVSHYFAPPGGAAAGLDPVKVKESISSSGPAVGACWEAALLRRAGLAGGRSVRLRVEESGAVSHIWVLGNLSAEPATAADYLLDRCLVEAARKVRFPAGAAGDTVYSWVFAERR